MYIILVRYPVMNLQKKWGEGGGRGERGDKEHKVEYAL